jgi:hypothetical protein
VLQLPAGQITPVTLDASECSTIMILANAIDRERARHRILEAGGGCVRVASHAVAARAAMAGQFGRIDRQKPDALTPAADGVVVRDAATPECLGLDAYSRSFRSFHRRCASFGSPRADANFPVAGRTGQQLIPATQGHKGE